MTVTELWAVGIVLGFGVLLAILLRRPTTRSARSFVFVLGAGLVALASLALPRIVSVVVFAIDLVVVYQVVLNHTEWLASMPVAQARYSTFLSDAWDGIWDLRRFEDGGVEELAEMRGLLMSTIGRVEAEPAPDVDWDRLRTDSLDLMRLQVEVLDGNPAGMTWEDINRRWTDLTAEWWATVNRKRRFV